MIYRYIVFGMDPSVVKRFTGHPNTSAYHFRTDPGGPSTNRKLLFACFFLIPYLFYFKKSWPIFYSKFLYKMGQDFFDIKYMHHMVLILDDNSEIGGRVRSNL